MKSMTKFLPIFPLSYVVYPGQPLNLHIFEPRYKQLINDCQSQKITFGIPVVINGELAEYGTEVEITLIQKTYDNGEMDIRTRGLKVFRVMEVIREVPDKLYSAAIVFEQKHLPADTTKLNPTLVDLMAQLHSILQTDFDLYKKFSSPTSFDIAPYAALSQEDQYRLLMSESEKGRQWFLIEHLLKLIPHLEDSERLKSRVQMNGHFRNEISPNF